MATTKVEPNLSVQDEIAALKARIKELESVELDELNSKKADLETQLEAVQKRIEEILPAMHHPAAKHRNGTKEKTPGIQVSDNRLAELIKDAGGELSIRGGKGKPSYDIANIKKLVADSGGRFKLGGKSPWPTVQLA